MNVAKKYGMIQPGESRCGRMEGLEGEMNCRDWFFCTKELAEDKVWDKVKKAK